MMLQQVEKNKSGFLKETNKHLKDFGEVGLRTLVVAYKQSDEKQYTKWQAKYAEARATVGSEKDLHTEELGDEIEQGLTIVGGTGVEDKLKDGVPEAIDRFARAGIKIWVLAGDKVETAINIGYACRCGEHFFPSFYNFIVTDPFLHLHLFAEICLFFGSFFAS
jgi:phospholipid-translocating ATPase